MACLPDVSSALQLLRPETGTPVPEVFRDTEILASSIGLGWDGVTAEIGDSRSFAAENLVSTGHLLAFNLDAAPLVLEAKGPHGPRTHELPAGSCFICPAGQLFSHRTVARARWGAVELSTARVQRILGRPVEPQPGYAIVDEPLSAVLQALTLEAKQGGISGPLFTDGMVIALTSCLARRAGISTDFPGPAPSLKLVLEKIEDTLGEPMTVDALADIAGLSPAHFAREFKRHMHETPHAFVMRRRLERARHLMAAGSSIAETATACGFSDQAHLSRLFKRRFGLTPGTFTRQVRA